jgi:hypothetical protein
VGVVEGVALRERLCERAELAIGRCELIDQCVDDPLVFGRAEPAESETKPLLRETAFDVFTRCEFVRELGRADEGSGLIADRQLAEASIE